MVSNHNGILQRGGGINGGGSIGDRRIGFKLLRGTSWRSSWRSSDRTLVSRDGSVTSNSNNNNNNNNDDKSKGQKGISQEVIKRVHFPQDKDDIVSKVVPANICIVITTETESEIDGEEETSASSELTSSKSSLNALPEIHPKEVWYQKEDYSRFEKNRVLTRYGYAAIRKRGHRSSSTSAAFNEEKHCIRGLERMVDPKYARLEASTRKALHKSVKEEEERQRADGTYPNVVKLRQASVGHTRSARDRAMVQGSEDAKEARSNFKNGAINNNNTNNGYCNSSGNKIHASGPRERMFWHPSFLGS